MSKLSEYSLKSLNSKIRAGLNLAILFLSRIGGMLVALLFLPIYAQLLNTHEFGIATLILTGQALALTLDLGMAPLTARESAAKKQKSLIFTQIQQAEILLFIYYTCLLLIASAIFLYFHIPVFIAILCSIMYLALTLQNTYQSAMLGRSRHAPVAMIQAGGVLIRAIICTAALNIIESSIMIFLLSQSLGAVIHMAVSRKICQDDLSKNQPIQHTTKHLNISTSDIYQLAKRGLPLFLVGIAGAAAINFDKPIIAWLMEAETLAPYFLAATLSLTPLGILAAPVVQFFQPSIVRAYVDRDEKALTTATIRLNTLLLISVVFPTIIIWLFRNPIAHLWLRQETLIPQVSALSTWLLPAAAIGAIGNTPLALLVASSDFSFQARLSAFLTVILLTSVTFSAYQSSLIGICMSYLGYYTIATISIWLRCANQEVIMVAARKSAKHTATTVIIIGLLYFLITNFYV